MKKGMKAKIMIPTMLILVCVCAGMALIFKYQMEKDMISTGGQVAEYIADHAATAIDGNLVERIPENGEGSAPYNAVKNAISPVIEGAPVVNMYILYSDGENVFYMLDMNQEEPVALNTEYAKDYKSLSKAFTGNIQYEKAIIKTGNTAVITVYVPVFNRAGEQVAVLGCDYKADSVEKAVKKTMKSVLLACITCIVIAFCLFQIIIGRIIRNLLNVDKCICDIVNSKGDLTQIIEVNTGDEVEMIAGHVNELLGFIRAIMSNISDNSQKLNLSSENVVTYLKGAQESILDVSATMEEMNATMEETSASINKMKESVGDVDEFIGQISRRAIDGGQLSEEICKSAQIIQSNAVTEQQKVKETTRILSETVYAKIKESKEVEKIKDLTADIINITNQTNLLSLNANIEAARAGEAGRGFSVVASEMGKLATDSAAAAEQIQEVSSGVLNAVNELADEASQMLEFIEKTAMKGYSQLVQTSEEYSADVVKLDNIMKLFQSQAGKLKGDMDNIRQMMEAVNVSVEENTKGVNRIAEISVNITENVSDIGNRAEENKMIAGNLDVEVSKFKLS